MTTFLQSLGAEVTSMQDGRAPAMSSHDLTNLTADYDIVRKMRASNLALGPPLARAACGGVVAGGCAIGAADIHIFWAEALGARIEPKDGYLHAEAPAGWRRGIEQRRQGRRDRNIVMAATWPRAPRS